MSVVNLNFAGVYVAPLATAVLLNFGSAVAVVPPAYASVGLLAPEPVFGCAVGYDNAVSRPFTRSAGVAWQAAAAHATQAGLPWVRGLEFRAAAALPWDAGLVRDALAALPFVATEPARSAGLVAWDAGQALYRSGTDSFTDLLPRHSAGLAPWHAGVLVARAEGDSWVQLVPLPVAKGGAWQEAQALSRRTDARFAVAVPYLRHAVVPWQATRQPAAGREAPPLAPPAYTPFTNLDFQCRYTLLNPRAVFLNFGAHPCPNQFGAPLYVLPARFYMSVNNVSALRLPDMAEVPLYGVNLSADVGSFAWSFSATGPDALMGLLAPVGGAPVQIKLVLNGLEWRFVVDSRRRSHEFGRKSVQITGRSVTALLSAPFSREQQYLNSTAQTAQQLALQALSASGAGLDWGLDDWLVPAGAWSHTGAPLSAVQAIAQAAGGYVQCHRSLPTLLVRHPYPTLPGGVPGGPWNWGGAFAADVALTPDAVITDGIEQQDSVAVNGVYVSGTSQGVVVLVKRTGTAGELLGALVTDPLITHVTAATQRGLAVLGAAGAKYLQTLQLPVLTGGANPGVLDVGQLVQVNDTVPWRGRVRSVSVSASSPSLRQTVAIERHL